MIYRHILPGEGTEAAAIERACFPPNEAEAPGYIIARAENVPELFLVAYDQEKRRMAGNINGIATGEARFSDRFFTDLSLHDPLGENVMILSLEVLPEYRGQGVGRELMSRFAAETRKQGRRRLVLICLDALVCMYTGMGFADNGTADSSWGGEAWHEMELFL